MRFLLAALNAKYIHSNPAVHSLRAYAGEGLKGHIEIAEYTINQSCEEILADIYQKRPDVIGFSCYIWNISMVEALLAEIPKVLPGVPIWLGGPEVTYDAPKRLAQFPMVTGIMVGEGEETFRELLSYYVQRHMRSRKDEGGESATYSGRREDMEAAGGSVTGWNREALCRIPGLCLREGYTSPRELISLDQIPFLYEDSENLLEFQNRIIYYESSRGCPFGCSYCLSSIDRQVRLRDIDVVKRELQFFLDHKVKQVKFVDRTFNCSHRHAMEIWQYLIIHDNNVTNFHFEISADLLTDEEITLLNGMRPGLVQLEIGVQSANPRTIEAIHRRMDLERLERNVAAIHRSRNIHQHLDLIAGLPYEDYQSFGRSFDRVCAMMPDQLQLGFLKVLKGSEMHERAEEYGIAYTDGPPYEVLYTKWLSYEDVLRLKRIEEMVEIYYNSGQFVHTLRFLLEGFAGPFELFEKLADFYAERGYFVNAPARVYRYQVLLSFAAAHDGAHGAVYRELLIYDMYLRENLKSRPDFATELTPYKETIRGFYEQEERERRFLPDYAEYDHRQLARMTHLEPFRYPVWDMPAKWEDAQPGKERYVLFDYRHRNVLTGDVRTVVWEKDMEG